MDIRVSRYYFSTCITGLLLVLLVGCKTEILPRVQSHEILAMTTQQIERAGIYSIRYLEHGNYVKLKSDYDNNRLVFNPQTERRIFENLYAVYNSRVDLSNSLNRFVRSYPKGIAPLLYRGSYLIGEGWRKRGHKFANKTSKQQFIDFHRYHALAEKDLKKVLRIMPDNYHAMILLADIYKSKKDSRYDMNRYLEKAKAIHPESYPLWYSTLNASTPRWHGSIASMEKHISQMSNYLDKNDRLKRLRNRVLLEEATALYKARNYSSAKKILLKALDFGDDATALLKLGRVEEKLGNLEDACYYFAEAVKLSPFTWSHNKSVAECAKYGYEHL